MHLRLVGCGQVCLWANQVPGFFDIINISGRNQLIHLSDHCQPFLFNYLAGFYLFMICWFRLSADVNPLSANPTKWSNTLKQFVGNLPMNYLSVFDHFVGLALKVLR